MCLYLRFYERVCMWKEKKIERGAGKEGERDLNSILTAEIIS